MEKHAIACDALEYRAYLLGDPSTWYIRFGRHDLQACKFKLRKTIFRNCSNCTSCGALALARLPHPVANVSEIVVSVYLIDRNAAEEFISVFGKSANVKCSTGIEITFARDKPCASVLKGKVALTPRHPSTNRRDRFQRSSHECRTVAFAKWSDAKIVYNERRHSVAFNVMLSGAASSRPLELKLGKGN